jgi:hypothetical protein
MSTRVELGSARDLIAALESADIGLRMAVHRALTRDPARALAYGAHEGRDCVDVLVAQGRAGESSSALMACATLSAVDDPRVTGFFLERLEHGAGRMLTAATAYLLQHPFERSLAFAALLGNRSLLRARCAARALGAPRPEDPPAVALRLAILDPECTLPPCSGIWADLWEAELAGICAADARAGLGLRDAPQAKTPLPQQSQSELLAALEDPDWRVRAQASDALISLGEAEPVKGLVRDERLGVRAAAVQILMALGEHEWLEAALLAP